MAPQDTETQPGSDPAADAVAALHRLAGALPGGELRDGQDEMAAAVARAFATGRPLLVQAGTGTGKSLAYLVPAVLSGRRVVVATATKTLQDQLAEKDLPFLAENLGRPFEFAVLKGRSNYLCRQRLAELTDEAHQPELTGPGDRSMTGERDRRALEDLVQWAAESTSGDRAELPEEPPPGLWASVSVGPRECPGATRCPSGEDCFAEAARANAAAADVVVVNHHLYGLHLASGGTVLPEHDLVVLDEAHELEDTFSDTWGVEVTQGRLTALARSLRTLVRDEKLVADLDSAGERLGTTMSEHVGRRLRRLDDDLADAVTSARGRVASTIAALSAVPDDGPASVGPRKQRMLRAAASLTDDLDTVMDPDDTDVTWVESNGAQPVLRVAPVEVAETLRRTLWNGPTAVLTSATLPAGLGTRLGLGDAHHEHLDVGSPFDYGSQALLYCAAHLPDPRRPGFVEASHEELALLLDAAGGRTLALFTSRRAMNDAADALRGRLDTPILVQDELPRGVLVRRFTHEHETSLFATLGFWQGVDVAGPSLSLVVIDKLPFPRPDEPLLQARREKARADAFNVVDLPRAATLLAQGAGRLIRRADDRGVVAVLDPRLANQARYRSVLLRSLPPMRRTRKRDEALEFLRSLRDLHDPDRTV